MNQRWRPLASIASGLLVGILTAVVAFNVLLAATWSSIHGGMPQTKYLVLSWVAMASPFACGFLAAWATYRWLSNPKTPDA